MEAVSLSLQLVQTTEKLYSFLKNLKDAPTELQAISNTLQSLRSVLNDAHNILERQRSLAGTIHGTPRPLPTISDSLQRCKEQLQPLESIVDKYSNACQHDARKRDKLWGSMRLALKKKDMADFQSRIHQEITILNLSLGLESHNYGLHAFSAVMGEIKRLRATTMQVLSVDKLCAPGNNSVLRSINEHYQAGEIGLQTTNSPRSCRIISRQQVLCIPPFLRRLGFKGMKISKCLAKNERENNYSIGPRTNLLCEESAYTWRPTVMSFGMQWSWGAPYGNILPALTIYPVVPTEMLPSLNRDDYNIKDLKVDFSTGRLHPFMQSNRGLTLLHKLAAVSDRLDICQYLVAVGVSSRMMSTTLQAAYLALLFGCSTDMARFLFEHGFYSTYHPIIGPSSINHPDAELATLGRWLWNEAPLFYDDTEAEQIRTNLLCDIAKYVAKERYPNLANQFDFIASDPTALQEALVWSDSLSRLFLSGQQSCDSFEIGENWLRLLSELGLDVGNYLGEQAKRYTDGSLGTDLILDYGFDGLLSRRLLIDRNIYNEWSLGWEWVFDAQSSGYLVVSEFSTIAVDEIGFIHVWPFSDTVLGWGSEVEERLRRTRGRFGRKLAKKTQKELRWARKGMSRSKMPGSWI